jgi:hypothetical protein
MIPQERRKRLPGPLLVAGFCLPKGLTPVLDIYLEGILRVRACTALPTWHDARPVGGTGVSNDGPLKLLQICDCLTADFVLA